MNDLSGHYLLTSDITLTQNWEPIGWDNITPNVFTGSLNGDSHTIYNLIIDNSSSNNIGFFSELSGNVTNLNFENLIIRGRTKTGTIAGQQNIGSTISRVIIKNIEIKDYANKTGGIAGESSGIIEEVGVENLKISYQYKNNIGGIVGFYQVEKSNAPTLMEK